MWQLGLQESPIRTSTPLSRVFLKSFLSRKKKQKYEIWKKKTNEIELKNRELWVALKFFHTHRRCINNHGHVRLIIVVSCLPINELYFCRIVRVLNVKFVPLVCYRQICTCWSWASRCPLYLASPIYFIFFSISCPPESPWTKI